MSQAIQQRGFGTMGKDLRRKLGNDNDGKVLVVGKSSATGIGKTTFAIQLCRYLDSTDDEWRSKERSFIEIDEYIEAHMTEPGGACLLLDEIEAGADSRRAMSNQNVNLSKAWATMRAQNIATVATLPSVSMLDNRMLELCDYWVLVKERGLAQPFNVIVNDFNGNVARKPINPTKRKKPSTGEHIQFDDLPDDDRDKSYLDSIKDDTVWDLTNDAKKLSAAEHKKKLSKAVEEAKREKRNEVLRDFYNNSDLSTTDLSQFDSIGVSQSQVSEIINNS